MNIISKLNVAKPICNSLAGKHHTFIHRACVGVLIMAIGVLIAKTIGHHPVQFVAIFGDMVGYGIHGLGLMPFVDAIASSFEE
jgi:hypothetical protein